MKSNPTVFLVITALILAGGAYWYFSTQTGNQPPLTENVKENQTQTQFKILVTELNAISLDSDATSIFSNPNFTALADLATPVTSEASGRPDPFAPIPGASVIK